MLVVRLSPCEPLHLHTSYRHANTRRNTMEHRHMPTYSKRSWKTVSGTNQAVWEGWRLMALPVHHTHQARQTPSTGLRHPSPNHCYSWLRHRCRKTVSKRFFFDDAQTPLWLCRFVTKNSNYIRRFFYQITNHVAYASTTSKTKLNRLNRDGTFFLLFFTRGGCASCLRACLGAMLLPRCY